MYKPFKSYCIICEGKSEAAYIQEFNKILRERGISINLRAKTINSGHYTEVVKQYRSVYKNRQKDKIDAFIIWVDYDIYKRNEQENDDKYRKKPARIPNFKFNFHNFEDFLIMHLPDSELSKWNKICNQQNHFSNPMPSLTYLQYIRENIFADYHKGELPYGILSSDSLTRLRARQSNKAVSFKSDFAEFLLGLLD